MRRTEFSFCTKLDKGVTDEQIKDLQKVENLNILSISTVSGILPILLKRKTDFKHTGGFWGSEGKMNF